MLYQESQKSPVIFWGLLIGCVMEAAALAAVFLLIPESKGRNPAFIIVSVGASLIFVLFLLMRTLDIAIDPTRISFGFGPMRGTVPVSEVEKIRIVTFGWKNSGGWGIRLLWGWRWNWIAAMGGGVEIDLRNGKKRGFSTGNPDKIKEVLNKLLPGRVEDTRTRPV